VPYLTRGIGAEGFFPEDGAVFDEGNHRFIEQLVHAHLFIEFITPRHRFLGAGGLFAGFEEDAFGGALPRDAKDL
jgi:hypothetical protein